ncbi:MAG: sigma 54-interacting transcriptional regulator [bacterium]
MIDFTKNIEHIKNLSKEQFEALHNISHALNSTDYTDSLIEDVLNWVIHVINAERGVFVRYDEAKNDFVIIAATKVDKHDINDLSAFSSGLLQEVIKKKEPLLTHDLQSDPNLSQFESVQLQNIKSVIAVPITQKDKIWGVILADSRINRKEFTEENLLFLNFFSSLVSLTLDRITSFEKLRDENLILLNKLQSAERIPDMVGESKVMKDLSKLIHRVAATDATVLILGESGTGKDLVARAIHKLSNRYANPYLAQFCGSISENLLESELFGYKKGAFTGAISDKKGLLEVAEKGTFFLDEIADVSPALQSKLLRVLENREIIRVGDTSVKKIDVRIIAATNKDLSQLVKEGKFREDLFYRLNVFPVRVPPLRERSGDIILIANDVIQKKEGKKKIIHPDAITKLENYYWPGNVRQLINVIQRALIMSDTDKLLPEHIILEDEEDPSSFRGRLHDFEKMILLKRLSDFDGNKTLAARSLDVSVRWVQLKLKEIDGQE